MDSEPPRHEDPAQRAMRLAGGAPVHVVDDDEAVRRAIGLLLRAAGLNVALHASADAFLDEINCGTGPIACVLTDLRMPGLDGIGLLRRLRGMGFVRPVILITARGDVPVAVRAMKEGAADFIEKPCDNSELLSAIAVALDHAKAPPSADPPDEARGMARSRLATLSPRERQVLELLAAGHGNKSAARVLGLSPRTIEIHRARMMGRLGVRSFADAVRLVVQAELPAVAAAPMAISLETC